MHGTQYFRSVFVDRTVRNLESTYNKKIENRINVTDYENIKKKLNHIINVYAELMRCTLYFLMLKKLILF